MTAAAQPSSLDHGPAADPLIFGAQIQAWDARMERALSARLPEARTPPARLHAAMRHSLQGAGPRVRPALLFAAARAVELREDEVEGAACAVELMHAYTRVHDEMLAEEDDRPARRARPPCHEAYDEATAILVGDALPPLAFELLAHDPSLPADPAVRLRLIELLAQAGGAAAVNVNGNGKPYVRNGGALIGASVQLAAACAPAADASLQSALAAYAGSIASAFALRERSGVSKDPDRVRELVGEAQAALAPFGARAMPLRLLTDWLFSGD